MRFTDLTDTHGYVLDVFRRPQHELRRVLARLPLVPSSPPRLPGRLRLGPLDAVVVAGAQETLGRRPRQDVLRRLLQVVGLREIRRSVTSLPLASILFRVERKRSRMHARTYARTHTFIQPTHACILVHLDTVALERTHVRMHACERERERERERYI